MTSWVRQKPSKPVGPKKKDIVALELYAKEFAERLYARHKDDAEDAKLAYLHGVQMAWRGLQKDIRHALWMGEGGQGTFARAGSLRQSLLAYRERVRQCVENANRQHDTSFYELIKSTPEMYRAMQLGYACGYRHVARAMERLLAQ